MVAPYPTSACSNRVGSNLGHTELEQPSAGADDIGDRVNCPHFVKMNVLFRDAVDLGLGSRKQGEDRQRRITHCRFEGRELEERTDCPPVPRLELIRSANPHSRTLDRTEPHWFRS